ncbi:MAG: hypothetical protein LBT05_04205, partial [Planctomycetaceae bacterium]|nr:hypothetical protein [Planctomycetaceae bacterium]
MTDDIFQLPQGFEIKTPTNIKEYISELRKTTILETIDQQYGNVSPSFYYQIPERVVVDPPKHFTEPPPRKGRGKECQMNVRKPYQSDLSDEQWQILAPMIILPEGGRPRTVDL